MSVTAPPGPASGATAAWARSRVSGVGPPLAAGAALLLLWESLLRALRPDGFLLPAPTAIVSALLADAGPIWSASRATGFVVVTGLAGGIVLGVVAALLTVRFRAADRTLTPLAAGLNAMPIIALAPLFNAWFGSLSPRSNQAVVAVVVFFPVFLNTARGLTRVDSSQLELMRSYAAGEWTITREVRIPNALPLFFTALKIVASLSVIAAIVAEYFGGRQDALGPLIVQRAALTRYAGAWAAVVAGALMGLALYLAAMAGERWALPWHASTRQGDR
jgi:NitT/TauT family transport system permease protein